MSATHEQPQAGALAESSICDWCKQDMADPDTRTCTLATYEGYAGHDHVDRIRFGYERGADALMPDETCNDCGVRAGAYHHPGCDVEQCPVCFGQAIGCDCPADSDTDSDDDTYR